MTENLGLGVYIDPTGATRGAAEANRAFNSLKQGAAESEKAVKALSSVMTSLRGLMGGVTIVTAFNALIGAAKEAEQSTLRLDAQLRKMGEAAKVSKQFIDDLADSMSAISGFDDDNIKSAAIGLLELGLNSKKAISDVTQLGVAFAALKPELGGVENATNLVARALKNPERGLMQLRIAGIAFGTDAEKQILTLSKMGETAEAAALMINAMENSIGGSSQVIAASLDTISGKTRAVETAFGNLIETFGRSETFTSLVKGALDGVKATIVFLGEAIIKTDFAFRAFFNSVNGARKSFGQFAIGEWSKSDATALATEQENIRLLKEAETALASLKSGSDSAGRSIKATKSDYVGFSKAAVEGLDSAAGKTEELKKKTKELDDTTKKLVDTLQSGLTDSLAEAFKVGEFSFKGLYDNFRSTISKMQADAILNPIFLNIKTSMSGGSGASSNGAFGSVLGGGGSSFDISGVSKLFGGGSSLGITAGVKDPVFGYMGQIGAKGAGGVASGGGFMSSIFGSGGGFGGSVFGAGGTSLGTVFGNSGYGFIGSTAANLFGLGGGMGGQLGGTAGSLIGSAVGGPIGAIAGGFIGSALGGLFGGKPKPSNFTAGAMFNNLGEVSAVEDKANDNTRRLRDSFVESVSSLFSAIRGSVAGATFTPFGFDIGERDPTRLRIGGDTGLTGRGDVQFGVGDAQAALNYITNNLPKFVSGVTGVFDAVIKKGGDLNRVLENLGFAKAYTDIVNYQKPLSEVQQNLKQLTDNFIALRDRMAELNYTIDPARNALASQFNSQIGEFILGIENPMQLALDELKKDSEARVNYARLVGADVAQVEKYNNLLRLKILEQYGDSAVAIEGQTSAARLDVLKKSSAQIKEFLDSQIIGSTSTLSPFEKYQEAQAQFNLSLSSARQSGDTTELVKNAGELLQLGQAALGGATADYSVLQNFTRATLTNLAKELKLPAFAHGGNFTVGGSSGVDSRVVAFRATAGEQIEVTPAGGGATVRAISQQTTVLAGELRVLTAQVSELVRQNDKLRAQVAIERRAVG